MKYFTRNVDFNKKCQHINRSQEQIKTDIEELQSWLSTQKHLPKEAADERLLEKCILTAKGDLDKAQKRLDAYFTVRNFVHYIYENRDPLGPELLEYNNDTHVGFLPGLTPDGSRVLLLDNIGKDASRFNQRVMTIKTFNALDIWLRDDPHANSLYALSNAENSTLGHVMKLSVTATKESIYCIQHVLPISLKGFFILNSPSVVRVLVEKIIKPLLSKKLAKRFLFVGDDYSKIHKYIPIEMLPKEYGGTGPSGAEINETWNNIAKENRDWLLSFGSAKTDESLREEDCPYNNSSCRVM